MKRNVLATFTIALTTCVSVVSFSTRSAAQAVCSTDPAITNNCPAGSASRHRLAITTIAGVEVDMSANSDIVIDERNGYASACVNGLIYLIKDTTANSWLPSGLIQDSFICFGDGTDSVYHNITGGTSCGGGFTPIPYNGYEFTSYLGLGSDWMWAHSDASEDEAFCGADGMDTIYGLHGDDNVDGGRGNDYLYGGEGYDVYTGGAGNDSLIEEHGETDFLFGGSENDCLQYEQWGSGGALFGGTGYYDKYHVTGTPAPYMTQLEGSNYGVCPG